MPTKPVPRITAWSYSRLNDYEKCPLMARFKHVDRLKEPGNAAMNRGSEIDKLAEQYSTGTISKPPPELALFKKEFNGLRKIKRLLNPQKSIALDKKWQPTDWFGPTAWLRIKMDVFYDDVKRLVRKIIDYKTGKIRDEHKDQLELYAIGGFAEASPGIEKAETELWYLDQGEIKAKTFTRAEAEALKPKWEKRVLPVLTDTKFKATPGYHCTYCFYGQSGKAKGGPGLCKF